ncbi:hypothetical protein LT493_32270 [Streptomyces tricolor]|nr:hypothetical protein [Streptomyces tricolor]
MPTSSASTTDSAKPSAAGGGAVPERAFDLLERMADAGGEVGLSASCPRPADCRCRPSTG